MRFSLRKDDFVDNNSAMIHDTAIQRAITGAHRYSPIGIPRSYQVMTEAGSSQSDYEDADDAEAGVPPRRQSGIRSGEGGSSIS